MSAKGKAARAIFRRKGNPYHHISAPTPYAARMLEAAGFEYIFLGGDVTFGTMLGKPGVMLTLPEKVAIARYFVEAVNIPVIMDCDEIGGLGPAWAARACQEYIRTGLAGMDIDDRLADHSLAARHAEREPGITGVISVQAMVDNIRAIVETRAALDPDFLLRVRCYDFWNNPDVDDTIRRLQAYESAGAEVLYLGGPPDTKPEVYQKALRALKVPCTVPAVWMTYEWAKENGVCEIRTPYELEMIMHSAGWEFLVDFRKNGARVIPEWRKKYAGNPFMARGVDFYRKASGDMTIAPRPKVS
jgi:2-methylisocitrate lyase-like PEP mutase family enzyme